MKWNLVLILLLIVLPSSAADQFYASGPNHEKRIALTFDDGPGPMTPQFLDLLDRYQVKATFFVLGELVEFRKDLTHQIHSRGHEVASHTMTHENYLKIMRNLMQEFGETATHRPQSLEAAQLQLKKDMEKSRKVIENATGSKVLLCRMPHGADAPWIRQTAQDTQFVLVNWTYGSDWTKDPLEAQIKAYTKAIKPGAILLFHDGGARREKSLQITEAVLKAAQEQGFQMVPVGQLLGLK